MSTLAENTRNKRKIKSGQEITIGPHGKEIVSLCRYKKRKLKEELFLQQVNKSNKLVPEWLRKSDKEVESVKVYQSDIIVSWANMAGSAKSGKSVRNKVQGNSKDNTQKMKVLKERSEGSMISQVSFPQGSWKQKGESDWYEDNATESLKVATEKWKNSVEEDSIPFRESAMSGRSSRERRRAQKEEKMKAIAKLHGQLKNC